jgi:predicted ABC-class ATPase
MTTDQVLFNQLQRLDGQSYKAYKSLQGKYDFGDFTLIIEHVQGDPFAAPSRVRVQVPQTVAQFPQVLWQQPCRAVAVEDFLIREFYQKTRDRDRQSGSGKSGLVDIVRPSQAILKRTAATITADQVELRFTVGLPAFGRRIAGRQAASLLCESVPALVNQTLRYDALDAVALKRHVDTAEDAEALRYQLTANGLVAFIANGAILPRHSGVDDRPLTAQAIPFQSPQSLQVILSCPNSGELAGMGIPIGITLIVGGGYHGKSTLLRAIEAGIYNHGPGDGREQVVSHPTAVKVRAEDGRSVSGVDISPFINSLPQGKSTVHFSTSNASGSTSQATNIMEAIEAGGQVLLVDEDTSATNFMIRDRRMQALIAKAQEPITPFIDKVRQLETDYGISTVLVMGGSGDYFDVADTVIAMHDFCPQDVTQQAKTIAHQYQTDRTQEGGQHFGQIKPRVIDPGSIDPRQGKRRIKLRVRDTHQLQFGTEDIDLAAVEQLVEPGQLRAIAAAIVYAQECHMSMQSTLREVIEAVIAAVAREGMDCLAEWPMGELVSFRGIELAAAINRLRTLRVI